MKLSWRLLRVRPGHDRLLYWWWTFALTSWVYFRFLDAMWTETGGAWSAPLDDTFIHFNYARSIARGRPFEWSYGCGYSSGATSLIYPWILAPAFALGLRGTELMGFAVAVSLGSILLFFRGLSTLTDPLDLRLKYLAAPVILAVGFIDWALVSGMESALMLGAVGCTAIAMAHPERGLWVALSWVGLVGVRPEGLMLVGILSALLAVRGRPARAALLALPALALWGAQSLANWLFTGSATPNGSELKVIFFDATLSPLEKLSFWWTNLSDALGRIFFHHLSAVSPVGMLILVGAVAAWVDVRTRRGAIVTTSLAAGWLLLVSCNTQLRFQNDRYAVVGVALLVGVFVLGVGALIFPMEGRARPRVKRALGVAILTVWSLAILPRWEAQRRFFGAACRNIAEQQLAMGPLILKERPSRVMVGDAGAMIFAADVPGLDGVGLGGYQELPFARAYPLGEGATLELIERMPSRDRPSHLALYPSWWGDLPSIFGQPIASKALTDNVICGDSTKTLYKADWSLLRRVNAPRGTQGVEIVDVVDLGDLVSEHRAGVRALGKVPYRILRPAPFSAEVFDGGRVVSRSSPLRMRLNVPTASSRVVVRTETATETALTLTSSAGELREVVGPERGFSEVTFVGVPPDPDRSTEVTFVADRELTLFHVWVID